MTRADHETSIAQQLVERFDQSGEAYTCLAVVYGVISHPAHQLTTGTTIRPRRVINLAADMIHARTVKERSR